MIMSFFRKKIDSIHQKHIFSPSPTKTYQIPFCHPLWSIKLPSLCYWHLESYPQLYAKLDPLTLKCAVQTMPEKFLRWCQTSWKAWGERNNVQSRESRQNKGDLNSIGINVSLSPPLHNHFWLQSCHASVSVHFHVHHFSLKVCRSHAGGISFLCSRLISTPGATDAARGVGHRSVAIRLHSVNMWGQNVMRESWWRCSNVNMLMLMCFPIMCFST